MSTDSDVGGFLQRQCACGQHTVAGGECESCRQKRLQRKAAGHSGPEFAPPIVHEVLRSPGQPLDATTRAFMEPRFGHDFSRVRVHTDARAGESAQAVNALAYTVGNDIIFARGSYVPHTISGDKLLAHELTHSVQQSGASPTMTGSLPIGNVDDGVEREAGHSADAVIRGEPAEVAGETLRPVLRRQPQPEKSASPPEKKEGTPASGAGTTVRSSATILDKFELDSDVLLPAHRKVVDKLAWSIALHVGMLAKGRATIAITGHTDRSGDEQRNQNLGQRRADNVHASLEEALRGQRVTAEQIAGWTVTSLGETAPLIDTPDGAREPRNRRVEVEVTIESLLPPRPTKEPDIFKVPQQPGLPGTKSPPTPPAVPTPSREWLEEALKRDPLLKKLPKWANEKVVDGLKDADELAAGKVIDALPIDDKEKAAMKAAIVSVLQLIKGRKFQVPIPSPYEPPSSTMPEMPKAPGEKIFKLPPIRF